MAVLLVAFAALAFIVWLWLRRPPASPAEVVYRDGPDMPTLFSREHRLAGRPDYVTREAGGFVPVEVKSRSCGGRGPYPGERAQLLAYCLLTEQELGPVARGELHYADRRVVVRYGDAERGEIVALLAQMREADELHRSHRQAARCHRCGFRGQCEEALG